LLAQEDMSPGLSEPRMPSAIDLRAAFLACLRAHQACEEAVAQALRADQSGGVDERVGALLDCADVCRTTATFIRRGSPLAGRTAGIAADLCERAAEACAPFAGDGALAACAQTCRRCAAWCRRLAALDIERAA